MDKMQEAFEKWATDEDIFPKDWSFAKKEDGEYLNYEDGCAFMAWQATYARIAELEAEVERLRGDNDRLQKAAEAALESIKRRCYLLAQNELQAVEGVLDKHPESGTGQE